MHSWKLSHAVTGKILIHEVFNDYIRRYGNLYRIGENLFHQIFLQCKGSWAMGLAKILSSKNFQLAIRYTLLYAVLITTLSNM